MSERRVTRRLVAVLASDVVNFSAMMSRDEYGTLAALKKHREKVFDPAVNAHRGRLIKLMGDGALVEFISVVDAIDCAVAIQNASVADPGSENRIEIRIGINLGDVIFEGEDIYGNGVNIAARLEPLASPGGICVSSVVKDSMGGRAKVDFADGGTISLKNIEIPVHVWHWQPSIASSENRINSASFHEAPRSGQSASIAVLPFDNMSGQPEQEYFSDGISEDLITDLSKISGVKVIARNSSFAYKGQAVDLRTVGRELGVTHILEGSVRRAGDRVRINGQLIEAESGTHIWAERYDRDLTDIFEVQDEVTLAIVDALKIVLKPGEADRISHNSTTNTEAYDHYIRARSFLNSPGVDQEMFQRGLEHCQRAIELDPEFADSYAMFALFQLLDCQNSWTEDSGRALDRAEEYSSRAVEIGSCDPVVYQAQALTAQMTRDSVKLNSAVEKALELGPNNTFSLFVRAMSAVYRGEPELAFEDLEKAMRLEPSFSHQLLHFIGLAHFFMGNYEAAQLMFRERLINDRESDGGHLMLASTLGHLGLTQEAKEVWADLRKLRPEFSYKHRLEMLPYQKTSYRDRIYEGLENAGVADE